MSRLVKVLMIMGVLLFAAGIVGITLRERFERWLFEPTETTIEQGVQTEDAAEAIAVVALDLAVPWEVAFMPGGDMLVTERPGTLKRIGTNGASYPIAGVEHTSEGGLLGLALHPQFKDNSWLYVYLTTLGPGGLINRIERYTYANDQLNGRMVILDNIPASQNHDGGRLAFGPDGKLYATTGDAGSEESAQDTAALSGKILRLNDDGSVPGDNPFNNPVYSYGHRNPQGLAWDDAEQLWATEHGRSGVRTGFDELNLIKKGANYGWPDVEGDETKDGTEPPVAHSGATDTWAPASLAYWDGSLFFGGLRGQSLYEAKLSGSNRVELKAHFAEGYGRIRTVVVHDGAIYFSTSNTDGRGSVKPNDDKIIRVNPRIFRNL